MTGDGKGNIALKERKKNVDKIDQVTESILQKIDGEGFKQEGAYNLRYNGYSLCHGSTEHIKIEKKEDKQGIDVYISSGTKGEQVHIPVVVAASGVMDEVYNDFYIGEGAEVTIVAGCGIHTFHIGEGANVRYEEKHYGEGEGTGARILNPVTKIIMEAHSVFTLDTVQIKGVDSTKRETEVVMGEDTKLFVVEKLMTHGKQDAVSNMDVCLNGTGSSAQARVYSIPEIDANHVDAAIIHEAAIGRINNEQLIKLNTFGLSEEEAEAVIIDNFLN